MSFSGAVLTGGRSRRMGQDKAFLCHEGRPLAEIARRALLDAGAREVLSVGGDLDRLQRLGFTAVPDDDAGEGPLGGLLTALRVAGSDWVVVLACDLPLASAGTVRELLSHTGEDADAVVPLLDGRPQPAHAVWRRDCRAALSALYAQGERRLTATLGHLRVRRVSVHRPATLIDVDTQSDLHKVSPAVTPAGGSIDRSRAALSAGAHPTPAGTRRIGGSPEGDES